MPAPRRNWRRDNPRWVETNEPTEDRGERGVFIRATDGYLLRKSGLATMAWMRLRTP